MLTTDDEAGTASAVLEHLERAVADEEQAGDTGPKAVDVTAL
jgi:hypothetical protein